jgi:hypothetical protein
MERKRNSRLALQEKEDENEKDGTDSAELARFVVGQFHRLTGRQETRL